MPAPPGGLVGFEDAVRAALTGTEEFPGLVPDARPATSEVGDPQWTGETVYRDENSSLLGVPAERAWAVVESVGGERGWFVPDALWRVRGLADRLVGGPGARRGRPDRPLQQGDAVDHWHVVEVDPGRRLLLRTEMRLPGQAWLELSVEPTGPQECRLTQRAVFHPKGLTGHLYWGAMLAGHVPAFRLMHLGMVREISEAGVPLNPQQTVPSR